MDLSAIALMLTTGILIIMHVSAVLNHLISMSFCMETIMVDSALAKAWQFGIHQPVTVILTALWWRIAKGWEMEREVVNVLKIMHGAHSPKFAEK